MQVQICCEGKGKVLEAIVPWQGLPSFPCAGRQPAIDVSPLLPVLCPKVIYFSLKTNKQKQQHQKQSKPPPHTPFFFLKF